MTRKLSPYEKTHLQRFGKGDIDIADYGEMPVEYITGKVEFGEQVFEVNKNVLIPRVETEEFVNLALEKIEKEEVTIADVGCGSGAIGISVWLELQKKTVATQMYLSDISAEAIKVTKRNVSNLIEEDENIKIFKSDLLESYPKDVKFDLIMANLPYIPSGRVAILDESVRKYEPHLALDGGEDGLKHIERLIKQAKDRLNPGGVILLEVDYTHDDEYLRRKLALDDMQLETKQDQFQRMRFAIIIN
ncbi:MAG: peptide chain release factor N(5)-glutamine methyltransferase [Candidatus Pacebacteria bacterium]|jgi:release factor glutamine methyltransferase|nr:peptide chain release factor N(5)-glutamine methyltransferase [Candidatus Paceibacterota bacterium]MBT3511552.1 peptide chain release factor N(5)-glutamine methyltransferase [Candidatus Paceibacterota bacterium]MBT4004978.1 peptide chain release factor N(5)-glutamine methyltransferase [Candidatus Paceibacterota bacterium]MBT4358754.1 peptide chain release factor N(5)-glutamine methyltransferase [Candidatus Paceibacterota bacterium]MBT4680911.1 peptide chain release factor N(5)-glutamine meth